MPTTIFISALWVFTAIQSPLLIACSYGLLRKVRWAAQHFVVFPVVFLVCLFWFLYFPIGAMYSHFLFAAAVVLSMYTILLTKSGYDGLDALVLASLTLIAVDELWQMPFNLLNWTSSLNYAEIGLATAGWNLMSIPLLLYFVLKFNGRISLDWRSKAAFIVSLGLTAFEVFRFFTGGYPDNSSPVAYPGVEPYYLLFVWFGFFLLLFRSSRIGGRPLEASRAEMKA